MNRKRVSSPTQDFEATYQKKYNGLTQRLNEAKATLRYVKENTRQDNREDFIQQAQDEREEIAALEEKLHLVPLYRENLYKSIYEHSLVLRKLFNPYAADQRPEMGDKYEELKSKGAKFLLFALYILNNRTLNKTKYCDLVMEITGNKNLHAVHNKFLILEKYLAGDAKDGENETFEDYREIIQNPESQTILRRLLKLT
jgi:hypothetical protein